MSAGLSSLLRIFFAKPIIHHFSGINRPHMALYSHKPVPIWACITKISMKDFITIMCRAKRPVPKSATTSLSLCQNDEAPFKESKTMVIVYYLPYWKPPKAQVQFNLPPIHCWWSNVGVSDPFEKIWNLMIIWQFFLSDRRGTYKHTIFKKFWV